MQFKNISYSESSIFNTQTKFRCILNIFQTLTACHECVTKCQNKTANNLNFFSGARKTKRFVYNKLLELNLYLILEKHFAMENKGKPQGGNDNKEKRRKESILDLSKYLEKMIRVKFAGGREAAGVLKGYDALLNLVLDNTVEYLRDVDEPFKLAEETRSLGLVVCRGTALVLICPQDGMESIPNPFISQDA